MADIVNKQKRTSWKLYTKWSVVEALLGSGMNLSDYNAFYERTYAFYEEEEEDESHRW